MKSEPLYKCPQCGEDVYEGDLTTIWDGVAHCSSCGSKREAKSLTPARIMNYKDGHIDLLKELCGCKDGTCGCCEDDEDDCDDEVYE